MHPGFVDCPSQYFGEPHLASTAPCLAPCPYPFNCVTFLQTSSNGRPPFRSTVLRIPGSMSPRWTGSSNRVKVERFDRKGPLCGNLRHVLSRHRKSIRELWHKYLRAWRSVHVVSCSNNGNLHERVDIVSTELVLTRC